MSNPFAAGNYDGVQYYVQGVADRIQRVRTFTREQCHAALALPHLQRTVEDAIHARLRKLDKEIAA